MDDRTLLELAAKAAAMVDYHAVTGIMRLIPKHDSAKDAARWNSRYANKECGTLEKTGYRRILFRLGYGATFKIRTHRLAWYIVHGVMPSGEIDHINQDKSDNRIANLRDVSKAINQKNRLISKNNTSGEIGVTWHSHRQKWCAQAVVDGKHVHLGLYEAKQDAIMAAKKFRADNNFTKTHGRAIVRAAASIGEQMK